MELSPDINAFASGITAKRPKNPQLGQLFFDTTLSSPVWWNGTAWEQAATGIGFESTCTLEQFGAVGDGTTDDSAAFAAAIAAINAGTYSQLLIGPKTYYVPTGSAPLGPDNSHILGNLTAQGASIVGQGRKSLLYNDEVGTILWVHAEDITLSNFSGLGTGLSDQHFILDGIEGQAFTVHPSVKYFGLNAEDFDRAYGFAGVYSTTPPYYHPILIGCTALNCNMGFRFVERAEYATLIGCETYGCAWGLYVGAGNINFVGGEIGFGAYGVYLATGANDGHGVVTGTQINHNARPVFSEDLTTGFTFFGVHIFDGHIDLSALVTSTVQFVGGQIDPLDITSSSKHAFINCTWPSGNANTIIGNPTIIGARDFNGTIPPFLKSLSEGAFGEATIDMNDADMVADANAYSCDVIKVTSTTPFSVNRTLTLPAPASDASAREYFVRNTQAGAHSLVVSTGAGTTISVTQGKGAQLLADSTGIVRMSADV